MAIETISPDNKDYETLQDFMDAPEKGFDYEEFAEHYNEAPIGDILVFEYRGSVISNFTKMMKRRGLEKEQDYNCKSTQAKSPAKGIYKVVLKKLTDTPCNSQ